MQVGYVEALQIQREKGCRFEQVESIELHVGRGIVDDCHYLNSDKQVALLSSKTKEWIGEQLVKGLCFSKFQENILIRALDFSELSQGVTLITENVVLEITEYSKKCFAECDLGKASLPCVLKEEIRFANVIQAGHIQVGERIWIGARKKE